MVKGAWTQAWRSKRSPVQRGEVLIADPWLAGCPSGLVNSQLHGVPVMVMPPSWTAVWCHWHSKIRLQTLR